MKNTVIVFVSRCYFLELDTDSVDDVHKVVETMVSNNTLPPPQPNPAFTSVAINHVSEDTGSILAKMPVPSIP